MKTSIVLVRNSQSRCMIVRRALATEPEQFAAAELQRYIRKVSGAVLQITTDGNNAPDGQDLPVLILAAEPIKTAKTTNRVLTALAAELRSCPFGSFAWQAAGKNLVILGRDGNGLLSGVYNLIETMLGVRFLAPGPGGEVIPRCTNLILAPERKVSVPAFRYRTINMDGIHMDRATLDWYTKLGLNVLQSCPHSWAKSKSRWAPEILRKRGWQLLVGAHISNLFFPEPDRYFRTHPEYYAVCRGQRTPIQICYSNTVAVRLMIEKMVKYVKDHPEINLFAPWPNDGGVDDFCQCKACRKIPLSRLLFDVHRKITEAVRAVNPRILVLHLCYTPGSSKGPPPGTIPVPNQVLLYCPYTDKAKYHPICDYRYGRWWNQAEGNHRAMCRDLRAWRQTHDVMIFSYYTDQIMKHRIYSPYPDVIQQELRYFKALGIIGLWDCLCYQKLAWIDAVNLYAYAKLLWNPDMDIDTLLRDFYAGYYGAGADTAASIDRAVGEFFRTPLMHGCQVEDIFWFFNKPCIGDYRPELSAAARSATKGQLDHLRLLGAQVRWETRHAGAVIRQRAVRLEICLDNLCCQFDMAMAYTDFCWWQGRREQEKTAAARMEIIPQVRRSLLELEAACRNVSQSSNRWQTLKPKTPGADIFYKRIKIFRKYFRGLACNCRKQLLIPENCTGKYNFQVIKRACTSRVLTIP